jgi:predicted HicB family RNase H-like nuclease
MGDKVGRPARDLKSGAAKIVPIRMSDAEKAAYQKAAKRAGKSLSQWIRDQLDRAAKRQAR